MANVTTSLIKKYWATKLQQEHYKRAVYKYITNSQYEATLKGGNTFSKSYSDGSDSELGVLTVRADIGIEDVTTTEETLIVDQKFATARQFDEFQTVQDGLDIAAEYAPKDGARMANQMDYAALSEIANAASEVDNGLLGGSDSDGLGIAPSISNIIDIFSYAGRQFTENNVYSMNRKAVISPKLEQVIRTYLGGRDTVLGDRTVLDGNTGLNFMGFNLYASNALYSTAVLSMAAQPADGDTVVIDGITFTFKTALSAGPAVKGEVLIGASADAARANLAALINAPGTTTVQGTAWTPDSTGVVGDQEYRKLENRATAVNDNSADTLTLAYKGNSTLAVSAVFATGVDTWTATKRIAHNFFCADTPVDFVQQIAPMVEMTPAQYQFAQIIKRGMYYGKKTFRENTFKMVDVKILV